MAQAEVKTKITATDDTGPAFNKAKTNLKEFGANLSDVGSKMTMMFTVPVVGGLVLLNKHGADASKTVKELSANFKEAMESGDPEKIRDAGKAWGELSPEIIDAAEAYEQMQAAMKPVNDEMNRAKTQMLTGLVPVVQRLTPMIVSIASAVADAATSFANMPVPLQNTIIAAVGLFAAAGPLLIAVGQITTAIGSAKLAFATIVPAITAATSAGGIFAGVTLAAALPVIGLVAAIGLLAFVIIKFGEDAWTTAKQLTVLGNNLIGGKQAAINTLKFFDDMDAGLKRTNTDLSLSIPILAGAANGWNNLTNAMVVNAGGQHHNAPIGTGTGRGNLYTGTWASSAPQSTTQNNGFTFNVQGGTAQDVANAIEQKIRELQRNGTLK